MQESDVERSVARGVQRGLQRHERQQAEAGMRSCLMGLLVVAVMTVALIALATYG